MRSIDWPPSTGDAARAMKSASSRRWSRLGGPLSTGARMLAAKSATYGRLGRGHCLIDRGCEGSVTAFEHDARQRLQYDLDPAHAIDTAPRSVHVFRPNADSLYGAREFSETPAQPLPDVGPIAHAEVAFARSDAHRYLWSTGRRHSGRNLRQDLWKGRSARALRLPRMLASCSFGRVRLSAHRFFPIRGRAALADSCESIVWTRCCIGSPRRMRNSSPWV